MAALKQHRCKPLIEHEYISIDPIWWRQRCLFTSACRSSAGENTALRTWSSARRFASLQPGAVTEGRWGAPMTHASAAAQKRGRTGARSQSKAAAPVRGRPLLSSCCCGRVPMETGGFCFFFKVWQNRGEKSAHGEQNHAAAPRQSEGHTSSHICVCTSGLCERVWACPNESLRVSFF